MVPPLEESEDGDRASFSRWEKRSVISDHFTELVLDITEMEMLPYLGCGPLLDIPLCHK
jgi:hypothetical protein